MNRSRRSSPIVKSVCATFSHSDIYSLITDYNICALVKSDRWCKRITARGDKTAMLVTRDRGHLLHSQEDCLVFVKHDRTIEQLRSLLVESTTAWWNPLTLTRCIIRTSLMSVVLLPTRTLVTQRLKVNWSVTSTKKIMAHIRVIEIFAFPLRCRTRAKPSRGKEESVGWKRHYCGSGDSKLAYRCLHIANSKPLKNVLVTQPDLTYLRSYAGISRLFERKSEFFCGTEDKSHNSPLRNDGYREDEGCEE